MTQGSGRNAKISGMYLKGKSFCYMLSTQSKVFIAEYLRKSYMQGGAVLLLWVKCARKCKNVHGIYCLVDECLKHTTE